MNKEEKIFVSQVFFSTFRWLDVSDMIKLYDKMEEGIIQDITECAEEDFNDDDIRCAIRRVLFNAFEIQD